jgi:hypothetical protein
LEDRNLAKRTAEAQRLQALIEEALHKAQGDERLQFLLIRGHLASLENVLVRQRAQLRKSGALEKVWARDLANLHAIEREHRQALQHAAEGIALQRNLKQMPQSVIAITGKLDLALGRKE